MPSINDQSGFVAGKFRFARLLGHHPDGAAAISIGIYCRGAPACGTLVQSHESRLYAHTTPGLTQTGYEKETARMDIRCGRQRGRLRVQAGHPAEDVEFPAQLVQALHLRMISAEIAQEVAGSPALVTSGFGTERRPERIDRTIEDRSQRMLERGTSRAVHEEAFGRGRMCCATARAYSR